MDSTFCRRVLPWICLGLALSPGCGSEAPPPTPPSNPSPALPSTPSPAQTPIPTSSTVERSLAEQAAEVRAGRSTAIRVTETAITVEQLSELGSLPTLQELELPQTHVSDRTVVALR